MSIRGIGRRWRLWCAAAGLALLLAACGGQAAGQASAGASASVGASPKPLASTALAPTASVPASASAAGAAASTAAASAPAQAVDGGLVLTLNSSNSKAEYQAQELLVGHSVLSPAIGSTSAVAGTIALDASGKVLPSASKVTINLTTLASDKSRRDHFIQGNTLETAQFPNAVFAPTHLSGLPWPLPAAGQATFQMAGNLTVHGVTRPTTWNVVAQFSGSSVSGKATAPFTISEFGMTSPKAGPVLSVRDAGTLEIDFTHVALARTA
ncbi:MAG TPA: YceI family protein [Chloroflexota bacterium]|nr:YceI family protein [Chloroflexota bacterium]